jgi:hypothetical protein
LTKAIRRAKTQSLAQGRAKAHSSGLTAIPAAWRWGGTAAPIVNLLAMRNVARTFTKNGVRFFVPSNSYWAWRDGGDGQRVAAVGRSNWLELKERIFSYWTPHPAFATFAKGAHISALRPHLCHRWFAVIDLQQFFENVTRTKICRALEDIGFSRPVR